MKRFRTTTELANKLGLKPQTLRKWRWQKKGPPYLKIGGKVLYDPEEISVYLDECRQRTSPEPPLGDSR